MVLTLTLFTILPVLNIWNVLKVRKLGQRSILALSHKSKPIVAAFFEVFDIGAEAFDFSQKVLVYRNDGVDWVSQVVDHHEHELLVRSKFVVELNQSTLQFTKSGRFALSACHRG